MSPKDALTLINCLLVRMFKTGPSSDDLNALLFTPPISVMPSMLCRIPLTLPTTLCDCHLCHSGSKHHGCQSHNPNPIRQLAVLMLRDESLRWQTSGELTFTLSPIWIYTLNLYLLKHVALICCFILTLLHFFYSTALVSVPGDFAHKSCDRLVKHVVP